MPRTSSIQNLVQNENPTSATAVKKTLTTVTAAVPNLWMRRSASRLETMVPPEMIMVTMPMYETGTLSSRWMTGQPEPKRESGSPRLMNAR